MITVQTSSMEALSPLKSGWGLGRVGGRGERRGGRGMGLLCVMENIFLNKKQKRRKERKNKKNY